jgi:UDP:flavonoid glycosyltransferase YjiC (YdhE family)
LPQCAGIVHHGGYGTTAAGFRAGIPALVIPHVVDQFYWGQKVHDLGVGPKPIRRADLESERLADALEELVQNKKILTSAASLGEQIRSESGVKNAVRLIEETFA